MMQVNGIELLQMIKDRKIKDKTIIKSQRNELTFSHMGHYFKTIDEYYIFDFCKGEFSRCDKNGKLGVKGQRRFMNYETLYKDFEIIEPTEEIEELEYDHNFYSITKYDELKLEIDKLAYLLRGINESIDLSLKNKNKINELVREVNHLKRNE